MLVICGGRAFIVSLLIVSLLLIVSPALRFVRFVLGDHRLDLLLSLVVGELPLLAVCGGLGLGTPFGVLLRLADAQLL